MVACPPGSAGRAESYVTVLDFTRNRRGERTKSETVADLLRLGQLVHLVHIVRNSFCVRSSEDVPLAQILKYILAVNPVELRARTLYLKCAFLHYCTGNNKVLDR
jgi:hypothetical protein